MAERVVYCARCQYAITVDDAKKWPDLCPNTTCASPNWRRRLTPEKPLELTVNDRKFLRSLRISPD